MSSTETQPTTPIWALGERMEKARDFAGIDRDEMAHRLGVSERTIRNYENGAVKVTRSTVIAYSMETNVPLEWFEDDLRSRCFLGDHWSDQLVLDLVAA